MLLKKILRNRNIISDNALRAVAHSFSSDGGQVGAKDFVSVVDIIRSDWAVF